jgi:hypothetical protein
MSSDYYLVSQQPIQRASRMRTLPEASSRHESGCTSVDPVVYYAYRIVLEASKLETGRCPDAPRPRDGVGKSDMAGQLPDSELPSSMDGTILVVAYSDKRCHGRATR